MNYGFISIINQKKIKNSIWVVVVKVKLIDTKIMYFTIQIIHIDIRYISDILQSIFN